jgi:hypothetical protein
MKSLKNGTHILKYWHSYCVEYVSHSSDGSDSSNRTLFWRNSKFREDDKPLLARFLVVEALECSGRLAFFQINNSEVTSDEGRSRGSTHCRICSLQ